MKPRYSDKLHETEGLFIMVVGEHGSGKTYMLRTCPRGLVVDYDGGMLTNHDVHLPYFTKAEIPSTQALVSLLNNPPDLEDGKPPSGIIIDSGTAWIDEILFDEIKGSRGARVGLTQQDWGRVFVEIQSLFLLCKKLVKDDRRYEYILINFHMEAKEDKTTNELVLGPSIPGGMFWRAGRHADLYIRLKSHTSKHSVVDQRGGPWRDRARVITNLEPPNVGQWLEAFRKVKAS
jgi:energy-coupling factor transporter ATP-binding protein EcfA2